MKHKLHTDLSSMPYQHLKLNGTQRLFVWHTERMTCTSCSSANSERIEDEKRRCKDCQNVWGVREAWVAADVDPNESIEQTMVWYSNRGFCTLLVRMCDTCQARWARHKRYVHGNPAFVNFFCDGCLPIETPKQVEMPKQLLEEKKNLDGAATLNGDIVGDAPTLFTDSLAKEPIVVRPKPGEKSNPPPKNPRGAWDALLQPNAPIKGRV